MSDNICKWYCFEYEMGFAQHEYHQILAEPLGEAKIGDTSAGQNPSRTQNNTICIFSHDTCLFEQNKTFLCTFHDDFGGFCACKRSLSAAILIEGNQDMSDYLETIIAIVPAWMSAQ